MFILRFYFNDVKSYTIIKVLLLLYNYIKLASVLLMHEFFRFKRLLTRTLQSIKCELHFTKYFTHIFSNKHFNAFCGTWKTSYLNVSSCTQNKISVRSVETKKIVLNDLQVHLYNTTSPKCDFKVSNCT